MANEKSVAEINELISRIEKELKPDCEIGARDRRTLKNLLKAAKIDRKAKFFPCRRENSNQVITHFVKAKDIPQSKFSMNAQPEIFILFP